MRYRALVSLAVLAVAGCGIDPESAPEDVPVSSIPAVTADATAESGPRVTLWFLDDERLADVARPASDDDAATALELLAEGPTAHEADAGLTTAVARQPLAVAGEPATDGVLTVEVTRTFSSVSGDDQLREVAQVVWTATEFDGVDAVRFATDGEALEVPTDLGLSDDPVDRGDYASLAPSD